MLHAGKGRGMDPGFLLGKLEGKNLRGRPRRRWENNLEIYLTEIRWDVVYRIYLAQDGDQCGGVL
jgi:hypothetical protein